jgi:hypothetical protein
MMDDDPCLISEHYRANFVMHHFLEEKELIYMVKKYECTTKTFCGHQMEKTIINKKGGVENVMVKMHGTGLSTRAILRTNQLTIRCTICCKRFPSNILNKYLKKIV